jgi:hypothetical protein
MQAKSTIAWWVIGGSLVGWLSVVAMQTGPRDATTCCNEPIFRRQMSNRCSLGTERRGLCTCGCSRSQVQAQPCVTSVCRGVSPRLCLLGGSSVNQVRARWLFVALVLTLLESVSVTVVYALASESSQPTGCVRGNHPIPHTPIKMHTRTHTHAHARTHARTHAHTHTHTNTHARKHKRKE